MKKSTYILLVSTVFCWATAKKEAVFTYKNQIPTEKSNTTNPCLEKALKAIPKGYVVYDTIYGDLNNDKLEDCVLMIKATDKNNIVVDEYRGELDRNRRGIIVVFNGNTTCEVVAKNYNCFSSENEEGGAYYAPELYLEIEKGNLYIKYAHGRYGYWNYTFRYRNANFELIGYDSHQHNGPPLLHQTSINFLTYKKQERENVSENPEDEDTFTETWTTLPKRKRLLLTEIKDFDELEVEN